MFSYKAETPASDYDFDQLYQRFGGGKKVHALNIDACMQAHQIEAIITYNVRDFTSIHEAKLITVISPENGLQSPM